MVAEATRLALEGSGVPRLVRVADRPGELERCQLRRFGRAAECTEPVTGYREVRYPKMDATRARVDSEMTRPPKLELSVNRGVLETLRTPTGV